MTPGTGRCPAGADLYARFLEALDEYGESVGLNFVLGAISDKSAVN